MHQEHTILCFSFHAYVLSLLLRNMGFSLHICVTMILVRAHMVFNAAVVVVNLVSVMEDTVKRYLMNDE